MAEKKTEKTEQEYVIPLRGKYRHVARYKKTPKAVKSVKEFIARHMRIYDKDMNKIKLDKYVNEYLWARGIKNPPHKIKVLAKKDSEGIVSVELVELPNKLKFKNLREEKQSKEALAKIENKKSLKERVQDQMKGSSKKSSDEKADKTKEKVDKNSDGIDDKIENSEKKKATIEAEEKIEKDLAKKEKKTSEPKKGVEKLAERKEYDQRSQHK
jgi:large subunit ribosomal protein L31e